MKRVLLPLAVLLSISAGCAGPRPVRTFVGRPNDRCRSLGEVRGFLMAPIRREPRQQGPSVLGLAQQKGADAIRFRSAVDEEFRGIAYACGEGRIREVRVPTARFFKSEPPGSCEEIGVVETTLARNQAEVREILTASAAGMGGNVMRFDSAGERQAGDRQLQTGVGTAFFCPDL
jgi:hypothetical protein